MTFHGVTFCGGDVRYRNGLQASSHAMPLVFVLNIHDLLPRAFFTCKCESILSILPSSNSDYFVDMFGQSVLEEYIDECLCVFIVFARALAFIDMFVCIFVSLRVW